MKAINADTVIACITHDDWPNISSAFVFIVFWNLIMGTVLKDHMSFLLGLWFVTAMDTLRQ